VREPEPAARRRVPVGIVIRMLVMVAVMRRPPERPRCTEEAPQTAMTNWKARDVLNARCEKYRW